MKVSHNIKGMFAWVLLVVFTVAFISKDLHLHEYTENSIESKDYHHSEVVKVNCFVCDFAFHKAEAPQSLNFNSIVYVTINTPYIITMQTVYRAVEHLNSHSPPTIIC